MKTKTVIKIAIAAIILVGGWLLLSGPSQPLTALTPLTKSSLTATAALVPAQPVAGQSTKLTFAFTDENGTPVTDLMVHHGRHVHVVIISNDLQTIGHIHPADFTANLQSEIDSGVYSVNYTFPYAGKYIVAADVMNAEDELSQQFIVNVIGDPQMPSAELSDTSFTKCFTGHLEEGTDRYVEPIDMKEATVPCPGGYQVTLTPASKTVVAGQNTLFRFHFEQDGKPVTDLVPYLSAALHLAIVPSKFDFALHRHGSVDEGSGAPTDAMGDSMKMDSGSTDTSGIHIMADGSVMLSDGKTVAGATVTSAGMVRMPDGTMVTPLMDLRGSSDGAAGTDSMSGMEDMHHHDDVPATFGPDLLSEPIQFPNPGTYRVFASVKHGGEIIVAAFMVKVESAHAAVSGETKSFDVVVKDKKIISGSGDIHVMEGDTVNLTVTSDTDEAVHLHGYDVSIELKAGVPGTLTFTATASGRFPLELEGSKTDLGAVSVMPK